MSRIFCTKFSDTNQSNVKMFFYYEPPFTSNSLFLPLCTRCKRCQCPQLLLGRILRTCNFHEYDILTSNEDMNIELISVHCEQILSQMFKSNIYWVYEMRAKLYHDIWVQWFLSEKFLIDLWQHKLHWNHRNDVCIETLVKNCFWN